MAGTGGARKRANAAKPIGSPDISAAVPVSEPPCVRRLVVSSGVGLRLQPDEMARSLGKSSLVTPCSTL